MSTVVAADVCRVVLVAPRRTLEMALPQQVALADLIPVLVQRVTLPGVPDRPGRGRGRSRALTGDDDWILQRLGGAPMEEELTPAALQIRDGETLYLRPRGVALPPVHFDDLIDGLATGLRERPDRWHDWMTRAMFLVIAGFVLTVCFTMLLDGGFIGRDTVARAVAVALLLAAMLCSRALGDEWAALILGLAAVPFAALAGFSIPPRVAGTAWPPASVLCAMAAVSLTALLATFVIGEHRPVFLAMWLIGAAGASGAMLTVLGLAPAQAAGAVVTLSLITSVFAPGISFRLARLRLPQLPTSAADLSEDIEPYPAGRLIAGAVAADTFLTWITVAVGAICAGGTVVLARAGTWPALALIATMSMVLLIRARGLSSGWQRLAALLPALLGPAALVVEVARQSDPTLRILAMPGLLTLVVIMLVCSRTMPGRRLTPYWGRAVDVFEYVFALGLVVLLLELFNAFQWARGLAG